MTITIMKTKKLMTLCLFVLLIAVGWVQFVTSFGESDNAHNAPAWGVRSGETGGDPILILTVDGLQNMRNDLTADYALAGNIDASPTRSWNDGAGFEPLGTWANRFTGSLHGQGFSIKGLSIDRPSTRYVGLFGFVDPEGSVRNVVLLDGEINGYEYVGGLVGENRGVLSNCYATGNVSGYRRVGGLVGFNIGPVTNSRASNLVIGERWVGGFMGSNSGSVSNCYATGTVGGNSSIGGLIGINMDTGSVHNCYATGGIIGTGDHVGGLIGESYAIVQNSFWDTERSGTGTSAGGTGKTTAELKTKITFTNSDWDFEVVWYMKEHVSYPLLRWQGDGTRDHPYHITNIDELQAVNNDLTAYYILVNNIDASATGGWDDGAGFIPIGTKWNGFIGSFNGGGHIITGLFINRPSTEDIGLFGVLRSGSSVSSVGLANVKITGNRHVGGLVGNNEGEVEKCFTTGTVSGADRVGSLVGYNRGSVEKSYATGEVSATYYVGGLVGYNMGSVSNCYATGRVSGTGNTIGGLAGRNSGSISYCYAIGTVIGKQRVGGLVGENEGGSISNSFWDTGASGIQTSDGGARKKSAEMVTLTTFTTAGWDIIPVNDHEARNRNYIWNMVDGSTCPFMSWKGGTMEAHDAIDRDDSRGIRTMHIMMALFAIILVIGVLFLWDKTSPPIMSSKGGYVNHNTKTTRMKTPSKAPPPERQRASDIETIRKTDRFQLTAGLNLGYVTPTGSPYPHVDPSPMPLPPDEEHTPTSGSSISQIIHHPMINPSATSDSALAPDISPEDQFKGKSLQSPLSEQSCGTRNLSSEPLLSFPPEARFSHDRMPSLVQSVEHGKPLPGSVTWEGNEGKMSEEIIPPLSPPVCSLNKQFLVDHPTITETEQKTGYLTTDIPTSKRGRPIEHSMMASNAPPGRSASPGSGPSRVSSSSSNFQGTRIRQRPFMGDQRKKMKSQAVAAVMVVLILIMGSMFYLQALQYDGADLEKENEALRIELRDLQSNNTLLEQEYATLKNLYLQNNSELLQEYAILFREFMNLQSNNSKMEQEHAALLQEFENALFNISVMEQANAALLSENEDLELNNAILILSNLLLFNENSMLSNSVEEFFDWVFARGGWDPETYGKWFITPDDSAVQQKVVEILGSDADGDLTWADMRKIDRWVYNNIEYNHDTPLTHPHWAGDNAKWECWLFPNETLESGRGDCEDKALLALSLFNADQKVYWAYAAAMTFDDLTRHMVIFIDVQDDKMHIYDPTSSYERFTQDTVRNKIQDYENYHGVNVYKVDYIFNAYMYKEFLTLQEFIDYF